MGINNSNLNIENINKIFVDKYADYLELMKIAGCSNEEIETKSACLIEYNKLLLEDRAKIIKDDMSFLDFFTSGGIVSIDDDGRKLYDGINKEVAHSIVCTMSSMKPNVELPKEYDEELNGPVSLPNVKDMVSQDMSLLFPDMKKLFLLGEKEKFHRRMTKVFNNSNEIEEFSDAVDLSVFNKSESGLYQYMDLIENAIRKSKEINFDEKSINLS